MTGDRPDDFDDLAARSRDRALRDADAIADVESALARVRSGSAAPEAVASSSGRRWVVLAAAALVAVVTVSAVVWLARGTDEQIATGPVATPPDQPAVEPTVPPTAPPTTGPAITVPPTTEPPTTEPPTTEPEEIDGVSDPCRSEPVAPPALVDGSAPGDEELVESDENRWVVWGGESFHAVTQILDVDDEPNRLPNMIQVVVGNHEGWVVPVGDPPLGAISLYWRDPADCVRVYVIASGHMDDEARDYLTRWLVAVDTGADFVAAFDPAFDAPTEYVAVRLVEAQFDDVRRLAPDGTDLGSHPDVDAFVDGRLPQGAQLEDGRRLSPERFNSGEARCINETVTLGGDPLHPELAAARAINTTPEGIVIAARDVCPDGASWGDPGSRWELVRLDLRQPDPQVEILLTRDPGSDVSEGESHSARMDGAVGVSAISPGGHLVALSEFTGGERPEWTIRSLTFPDAVIATATRCADPGAIIAPPVFVTDQRVVLARSCLDGAAAAMLVETVDIDTGVVDHSVEVADLAEWSEFRYITLSAIVDGGETWSIVSISDLDRATTAFLVRGDDATEITQPGFRTYAFTIDDLARR